MFQLTIYVWIKNADSILTKELYNKKKTGFFFLHRFQFFSLICISDISSEIGTP